MESCIGAALITYETEERCEDKGLETDPIGFGSTTIGVEDEVMVAVAGVEPVAEVGFE